MEDKINRIWYQMNMKEITSEEARQQVLDLFTVSGNYHRTPEQKKDELDDAADALMNELW